MYIGIDIGGTKCAVVLSGGDAKVLDKLRFDTLPQNPSANIENFITYIKELLRRNNVDSLFAIGISCGGPLNSASGTILSPPNLPGWDNIKITGILKESFGVPVFLQNDANACALAEYRFGAGRGCRNMIFLTMGTGMGAGLILDGRLYSGSSDMAGEVGHMRIAPDGPVGFGKAGSFEGFCSGGGIAQIAYNETLKKLQMGERVSYCDSVSSACNLTAKDIALAAAEGDKTAIGIMNKCARHLGMGLSILMDVLNPERIIIGSIFVRCYDMLWPIASQVIAEEALSFTRECCTVAPAQLGETLGDVAALSVGIFGLEL